MIKWKDAIRGMPAKGYRKTKNGRYEAFTSNHSKHKLTQEDVEYIRSVYSKRDPKYGAVALSNKFGVDRTTIHDIVNRKTWR